MIKLETEKKLTKKWEYNENKYEVVSRFALDTNNKLNMKIEVFENGVGISDIKDILGILYCSIKWRVVDANDAYGLYIWLEEKGFSKM